MPILTRKQQLEKEILETKAALDRSEARKYYRKYVEYTHQGRWIPAKFLTHICDNIDLLLEDELLNAEGKPAIGIIIQLPPQHGKSQTVTETLPSYYLGRDPYGHVIEISYGDDLAIRFGRRNKQKIEEFGKVLFGLQLSKESSSAAEFEIAGTKGGMISRGIGAALTGNPGTLILIDDPYKNREQADSENYRQFVIDEWLNTIKTRASAKCKFILIQTRWHEEDLAGYLLENEPHKWKLISFPCECEEPEEVTVRQPGDALFPEIGKDNEWLKQFKESYINDPREGGMRAWNALFQQRPTSLEGNMIKRAYWKRYTWKPNMRFDELIQSWDTSFKDTDGTDPVGCHVWGRIGGDFFLYDRVNARMDIVKTIEEILKMTRKHPKALTKLIEDKANGPAVISMLKRKVPGMIPIKATKSKAERVNAVLPLWEAGNVYIPDKMEISPGVEVPCPWANEVIEQCASFRPGKNSTKTQHDEDVDCASQALNRLAYSFVPKIRAEQVIDGYTTEEEMKDMGMAPNKIVNFRRGKEVC